MDKQSEEQLRLFTAVVAQSSESVVITTAQLDFPGPQIVYVNPAFTRMTGYAAEEVIGKTPRILEGPQTDRSVLDRLRADCEAGRVSHGETISYRKDGTGFYVEWSVGPVWNQRGEITHFVSTQRDITERRRVDESLYKKEQEFRQLFELSAVGMTKVSPEGRYLHVNRKLCQMLGYTEQEMLQLTLHEVTHPEDREVSAEKLNSSFTGVPDEYAMEKRYIRKDGSIIWILVSWRIIRDASGKPVHTVANIEDITARKLAEIALRKSQALNQAVLGSLAAHIAVLDKDGSIIAVNEAWERFARENDGNACTLGVGMNYLDVCRRAGERGDDDSRTALYGIHAVLDGSMPHFALESPCHSPTQKRWFAMSVTPLLGERGGAVVAHTNITKRKQIEEELQLSEERLELAMQAGDIGTFDWNIQTNEVVWTERSKAIFGKLSGPSQGGYEDWRKRLDPEDLLHCEASMREAFRQKQRRWQAEYRLMNFDKSEPRWINSQGHIFYDADGKPLRMIGVNVDVTERRQGEETLKQSAKEIHDLYNHAPCGYHSLDKDGRFVKINDTELEWLGYTREEVVGKLNFQHFLTAHGLETFNEKFPQFITEGMTQGLEFDLVRKDGTILPVLLSATAIKDRNGNYVMSRSVVYDITERKRAEAEREELLAREKAARAEVEHAAESIRRLQAVTDSSLGRLGLEDLLRDTLQRVGELLEADSGAILLSTEDGQSLVVRAAIGAEEATIGRRISLGEGIAGSIAARRAPLIVDDIAPVKMVDRFLRRGSRCLVGAPLIVEGRLIGVIQADTIAARPFTESDLRLLQLAADRIALAIEQTRLYDVEKQARQQAEESNRMKDEFLALVSHELRSPLNAMVGYARLLRFGELDAEKVKNAVEVIERGGKAQAQLIDDLLDTARIISGKLRLDIGPVDLVAVIEGAVQTIYPAADAKRITIQTDLKPKVGQITGDPERLQQVVWNLLSNAVKFTPAGGRVEVRLERIDPHICIAVSDTGKGIKPDFLPYVFDRFRQADASSSRRYGGLGLGLALVKYLVELHGGTIEAFSAGEGKGATFNVMLPVPAVSRSIREPETIKLADGPEKVLAGVRALVVDDEDDARELLKTVMRQYGADVLAARSAAEAFALITMTSEQSRPDVMVTDLGMPDEDGYSLLRRVREWEHDHAVYTPAVALTAYARPEDRKRALKAGFQMHIGKPVEPNELAVEIARLVKRPDRNH